MQTVEIGYSARAQFVPYHKRKTRWSCIVAHRRAGKTVACVADLIDAALRSDKPEARFAYMAPTYSQAKDVAWGYLKRLTGAIPGVEQRESDLTVNLPNGSRIRLYGSDNYERLRGIYLDGVVLDEAGDMDPRAWPEVIRPALADRQGWATFIGTPKGRNQFFEIWQAAQDNPEWTTLRLRASETGLIPETELKSAATMLTSEQYEAEFECSFDAAVVGAFYGRDLADAEREGRLCGVPYDPVAPVWTAWDLGISDTTSIWFAQIVGREVHVIDYYENSGVDLGHYVREIKGKPYIYGGHLLPHDAQARELGTGKTRVEVLQSLGIDPTIVTNHRVEDGINAVRMLLKRCWFDTTKTASGLDALKMYRSEWDDKRQCFNAKPVHDWASHACLIAGELVETERGLVPIEAVHIGDRVWTPSGISTVSHAGPVKLAHELIEIWSDRERVLTCTPEHKILTQRGFIQAQSLTKSDRILTGREWNAYLLGWFFKVINLGFRVAITGEMSGAQKGQATSTEQFTKRSTDQFQKAMRFITGTGTHLTMIPATLNAFHAKSIREHIRSNDGHEANYLHRLLTHWKRPLNGIGLMKDANGIGNTGSNAGKAESGLKSVVRSAISRFAHLILRAPNSAIQIAKLKHLDCAEGGQLVFDLTVEKNGCYRANGLMVSNSDAMRYLAMGLDLNANTTGFSSAKPLRRSIAGVI